MNQDNTFDDETKEQLKQLVLERINVMPDTLRVAIGSLELTKQEVAEHVRAEDEVGKQMIEMELEFLRALASGAIYAGT
jgi:hypothetical protein